MIHPERLLDDLDPEQRAVATSLDGAVRVLAGAGTGKTRAITSRIAFAVGSGVYGAAEGLAVTFTTRAAGELRARLARLGVHGVQARTFHSAALRQARYFWPQVYGVELPALMGSKLGLLAEAAGRNRVAVGQSELRDLAGEVEWAKVSNVRPDDYARLAPAARRAVSGVDAATVAAVYASYEEVKRQRQRIDLEDVLLCAAAVLGDDERTVATVRRQYSWFVVDEFQDVSPLQWALLQLWLGGRDELCVVGDPAQTIYTFAGASADYLLGFRRAFPAMTSLTLHRNYRSTPQILATANAVTSASRREAVELRATRPSGTAVTFHGCSDEVAEAATVAEAIAAVRARGVPASDVAVLFRVHAQSEAFEEALAERSIPYVVRGGERFFERPEVRQAVTLLRGAARAGAPPEKPLVDEVGDVLSAMGWATTPPAARGTARERWESLQALVSLADEVASAAPEAGMADLVAELQRRAELQQSPVADGVTLATLHAAKGLEWPVVFLAGMHEGTMPIVYADTPAAVEEERRLLYVGVTRARDELHVSWSAARSPGGRGSRAPSRFLAGLPGMPAAGAALAEAGGRRGRRAAAVTACRVCSRPLTDVRERKLGRCVDCPSSYDEALYDELRAWRKERAAAEKVPAYCVFTDATMTALAEMRPGTSEALARVPGIGRAKVDKYGGDLVQLCADAGSRLEAGADESVTPGTAG